MRTVNIKLVQTFLLVAEHGSFRRAAEIANRAPSAISMQVKDLEAQVGMRLFVRTAQRIMLTPEGQALFERTRGAMAEVEAGLAHVSDIAARRKGQVTIGCAPTLAATRMGNILANFARRFPDSVVSVREVAPREGLELLQQQKVEFYIGPEVTDLSDFSFEPLLSDDIVACAPPQFDAGQDALRLADLVATPIILLDAKTALHQLVERMCADADVTLNVRYEMQNTTTAMALVAAGLGVAILPTIAIDVGDRSQFRPIPLQEPLATRQIGVVTTKGYVQHGYSEQLLNFIRDDLGQGASAHLA